MTQKGQLKRSEILNAAAILLAQEGGSAFSMRAIADSCGLRLSHLQHYYPTAEQLLLALLETVLQDAEEKLANTIAAGQAPLEALVSLVFKSLQNQRDCQLIIELWALAGRSPETKAVLTIFYQAYINRVAQLVQHENNALTPEIAKQRAVMIVALLEGLSVIYSGKKSELTAAVEKNILLTLNLIIQN